MKAKVGVFLYHKDTMPFVWSRGGKSVEQQGDTGFPLWRKEGEKVLHLPGSLAALSL